MYGYIIWGAVMYGSLLNNEFSGVTPDASTPEGEVIVSNEIGTL